MGVRLTDAELAAFITRFRAASDDPHQDFGDVGFLFEEMEDHSILEELVAAREVIAAVRVDHLRSASMTLDVALAGYDKLFEGQTDE
jgi:hypothetical protein